MNATWPNAQSAAGTVSFNGQPGHLATITSLDESLFIEANFATFLAGTFGPWFGLSQSETGVEPGTPAQGAAGGWQWVTGEPFYSGNTTIFQNWAGGEPNNAGTGPGEDFGHFFIGPDAQGHQWNDLSRDTVLRFLIEFEPASTPVAEPATLLLLGSSLAGLTAVARRRRRSS